MNEELDRIKAVYRHRMQPRFSDRYSISRPGEFYMRHQREQAILQMLRRANLTQLSNLRVLEVGCGRGKTLADWTRWGALQSNLCGIDLMEPFIREAAELLPRATLLVGSAEHLPFPDRSFDIVTQFSVFSSILDEAMRHAVAAEIERVLTPAGVVLWYDCRYPNPRNPDVRSMRLRDIRVLFPGWTADVITTTLLPPVARPLVRLSFAACNFLESALPPLRSHYLILLKRPEK
jgi:ubiquinone/menaquinone biosynthesis C-methylase UbiE